MAGKHAKQRGRHAAETPSRWYRWLILLLVVVGLGSALPLLVGLGVACGILFGWMNKATTRT